MRPNCSSTWPSGGRQHANRRGVAPGSALVAAVVILAIGCGTSDGPLNPPPSPPPPPPPSPRLLRTFAPGVVGFYYNPPTLVAIYIGTSRGIRYPNATANAFYKLNASTLAKVWEYALGDKEVRGGAVLDGVGNVDFPVEEGRVVGTSNPSTFWRYSLDPSGALRWTRQIRRVLPNAGMTNPGEYRYTPKTVSKRRR